MNFFSNTVFSEIQVGTEYTFVCKVDEKLVRQFAMLSGDQNPTHLDGDYARENGHSGTVIHKMIIPMLLSGYFGNNFPGPGTEWKRQDLQFIKPISVGSQLFIHLQVLEKEPPRGLVLGVTVKTHLGEIVVAGREYLDAPIEHVSIKESDLPFFYMSDRKILLDSLIARAKKSIPPSMAVAWPLNKESLFGAMEACCKELVVPVFFGSTESINQLAEKLELDISGIRIVEASDEETACDMAAKAVGRNEFDILAKGSPHSDTFLSSILKRENNMRKSGTILSHVFYVDGIPPRHGEVTHRSMVITDGALNIAPDLMQKKGITQNAINFLLAMGVKKPRVAVLAAVEVVNPNMPATIDAAALTLMSMRGQITGGYVDGPLALDVATNPDAVKAKGIVSEVAGKADILLCPTIEVANVAAKEYEQMNALTAGVLCGAKKPVVLTSRSDDAINRLAAVAIACILL